MHHLSHIVIQNFRACRHVSLPLEGYTPLVGQNNTGKSTILEAICWILKPTALLRSDFCEAGSPVVVSACIEGITEEVLEYIPAQKHRKAIEPYCREGMMWIRATATGTGTKAITKEVWDVEQCMGREMPNRWREYPTGLPQAVSALLPEPLYVEAMEDIVEDLGKAKAGTTIKGLLDEIMEPVLNAHTDLTQALETIRDILTSEGEQRSTHLQSFDDEATQSLTHFFPGLTLDLDLQVVEAKEFFKAGDLHVTDKMTGDRRRFDQMGTGAQRAIQMALVRYLADMRSTEGNRPSRRLLLIDEPELYLHPQGIRRLRQALASLASSGFQVIFSTHSPLMLSRENAPDTVIIGKNLEAGVTTQKPLRQAVQEALIEAKSQSRTLFEIGNLAEIYFADRVVLCEGKTDSRLLPLAYERLYQQSPESEHTAFLSIGSCADIPKALPVLTAMGIKACAVADLDFAFTHARVGKSPLLDKNGEDLSQVKTILGRLQQKYGFTLGGNGLPTNDKKSGWQASDVWAVLAIDQEGCKAVNQTHSMLKENGVWIWPMGCIEQATGCEDKGEMAIVEQEERIRKMNVEELECHMPDFKACFDWIRSL